MRIELDESYYDADPISRKGSKTVQHKLLNFAASQVKV